MGQRSELFWSITRAEFRREASWTGEEARAKVSGWREDWRRERRMGVRVRRVFSSWTLNEDLLSVFCGRR